MCGGNFDCLNLTTHTHTTVLWLCESCPGTTRVSQYRKKHSPTHLSWSSIIAYLLLPSITIHSILPDQFAWLTVFFHSLLPSFLWSTSWPGTLHFILHKFLHPHTHTHTHTHNRFTALLEYVRDHPGWAGARKVKPGRLNQSGFTGARDSEWQWHLLGYMQVCTSSQTTTPTSHHSVFTGRMPFLTPNQQRQSTEGSHFFIQ